VSGVINLSTRIKKQLPAEMVDFLSAVGALAQSQGHRLYLVGGAVRDLLLERTNFDFDLVTEGDAVKLAQQLAGRNRGKIITHPRFGTAKIQWGDWNIDLATARSETYAKPGALPTVKSGSIKDDLFRRDFTINAMAIELNPSRYGQLLDPYDGRRDLEHQFIRVLHEKSFVDDATRIWRGLRYEQRLNFHLEPVTSQLLEQDTSYLDTISGDRLRHELELIFKEDCPEKVLCRADDLGVLSKLHPALKGDRWLAEKFGQARKLSSPELPSLGIYLALLVYPLSNEEIEKLISYLRLPKSLARTLRDTFNLKEVDLKLLVSPEIVPSEIYSLLHGYALPAIMANVVASNSTVARQRLSLFLNKLRFIKPALIGDDLRKMGINPGPRIKEILNRLLEARLDGKVVTKKDEEILVQEWLAGVFK
jgi:tRNA nucleotidyltransferase (CCA-adding enzyme)